MCSAAKDLYGLLYSCEWTGILLISCVKLDFFFFDASDQEKTGMDTQELDV